MPHLVQILLPLYGNNGQHFPSEQYRQVRTTLTERFGGSTAYTRAPAEGLWETGSTVKQDDIVVVEVMVETLERGWWREYKQELEQLFCQEQIVVRAQTYEAL